MVTEQAGGIKAGHSGLRQDTWTGSNHPVSCQVGRGFVEPALQFDFFLPAFSPFSSKVLISNKHLTPQTLSELLLPENLTYEGICQVFREVNLMLVLVS